MSPGPLERLDADAMARASAALRRACGISVAPGLMSGLEAAVRAAAAELALDPLELVRRAGEAEPKSTAALIEHAVVCESYFLRHPEHYAALRERVLPALSPLEPLRVWSAGCAGGEEPYSLALTLLDAGWSLSGTILGTDVSDRALDRARAGRYGEWSFRGVLPTVRARSFEPAGGQWRVRPELRRPVAFARHNLQEPPPPGGFHVVFCRNVLIYFEGEALERALATLVSALLPGGFLFVSPAEVPKVAELPLERVEHSGCFTFRKPERRPPPEERPAPRLGLPAAAPVASRSPGSEAKADDEPAPSSAHARALDAARKGQVDEAARLAAEVAATELLPEAFLLLATTAEQRGDLEGAMRAVRQALYLDATLAAAHASLAVLCQRLGLVREAAQSRRNALEALEGLDDDAVLRGLEHTTAGGLRRALGLANQPRLWERE